MTWTPDLLRSLCGMMMTYWRKRSTTSLKFYTVCVNSELPITLYVCNILYVWRGLISMSGFFEKSGKMFLYSPSVLANMRLTGDIHLDRLHGHGVESKDWIGSKYWISPRLSSRNLRYKTPRVLQIVYQIEIITFHLRTFESRAAIKAPYIG